MENFDLSAVTIPTPAPYDEADPFKQIENLCYVILQILTVAKAHEFTMAAKPLTDAVDALAYNGTEFDLGDLIIRFTGKTPIITGI
jgi:hypothetical protein